MNWSVVVVGPAVLIHAISLCNDGIESETDSSESRDPPDLTPIRTVASHHKSLSKKLCVDVFSWLIPQTECCSFFFFFFLISGGDDDDDDSAADTEDELQR